MLVVLVSRIDHNNSNEAIGGSIYSKYGQSVDFMPYAV